MKFMNPRQAAKIIGISPQQVRQACRKGLIKARKVKLQNGSPNAYTYAISQAEAIRYKNNRPKRGPKPRRTK